eukprot:TRINITY_DN11186_c0_g1_i2.p1 TRINITY_DN11186_c0_g1~~TRINITY_DN11186_c0_g1_i2.p1  ORF type:complete len:267 (-),score=-9.70 TRINITY_DN11186_c0_g1_i2:48-848(-)
MRQVHSASSDSPNKSDRFLRTCHKTSASLKKPPHNLSTNPFYTSKAASHYDSPGILSSNFCDARYNGCSLSYCNGKAEPSSLDLSNECSSAFPLSPFSEYSKIPLFDYGKNASLITGSSQSTIDSLNTYDAQDDDNLFNSYNKQVNAFVLDSHAEQSNNSQNNTFAIKPCTLNCTEPASTGGKPLIPGMSFKELVALWDQKTHSNRALIEYNGDSLASKRSVPDFKSFSEVDISKSSPAFALNRMSSVNDKAVSYTHLTLPTICSV